ncbi:PAX-interacting protein 1-like isoform X4 [Halichondria panicea]|uniref:PAX-interacting protein 1-like isoform X3 n=1 Tax=Halichondria panicea TaxID=6063 RepID=UPI00312B5444
MTLFQDVHYYIFDKNVSKAAEVKAAMKEGGATREFYLNDIVTHILSDAPIDPNTVSLLDCHVLHPDWALLSLKCGAQLPMMPFDLSKPRLLSGLTFTTSKMTRDDREKVAVLVVYYGGNYSNTLDASITHLVTMEMTGAKYECALEHSDVISVVTPDWILDCIDLNKRVDENEYSLSKNGVVAHQTTEPSLSGNGVAHQTTEPSLSGNGVAHQTTEPSLSGNGAAHQTIEPSLSGNGAAHPSLSGNSGMAHQTTEPTGMIVQTVPPETIIENGAPQSIISLPNHTPSTSLVPATPLTPSTQPTQPTLTPSTQPTQPTLTPSTQPTLLTTSTHPTPSAHPPPTVPEEVRQGAPSEESSDGSAVLLSGVCVCLCDYQECMEPGTVDKWRQVIHQHGGRVVSTPAQCTHLLALHKKSEVFAKAFSAGKCIASAHWLNDVLTQQKMFPPRNALHFPTAFKWQLLGADKYSMTLSNYTEAERELVKDMIRICGIPCTGHLDKTTTHLICKRPEGKKYMKAREWGVAIVNSTFLADTIHNGQVPAVLFPRYTRLGQPQEFTPGSCFEATSILKPWDAFMASYSKRHPELVELVDQVATPHTLTPVTPSQTTPTTNIGKHERAEDMEHSVTKKQKLDDVKPPVVLVTGISQSVAKTLKNSVVQLGGQVTERGSDCTHIVLPRVTRTVKFLCGISMCQYIVTPAWIESSASTGGFVREEDYRLEDKDAMELFGMTVSTSLARARARKLLKGVVFHSTQSVQPPHTPLKSIIECAGGELLNLSELRSRFGRRLERASAALMIISTPEDLAAGLCSEFLTLGLSVYNAELVLTGILRQELNFSSNQLSPL